MWCYEHSSKSCFCCSPQIWCCVFIYFEIFIKFFWDFSLWSVLFRGVLYNLQVFSIFLSVTDFLLNSIIVWDHILYHFYSFKFISWLRVWSVLVTVLSEQEKKTHSAAAKRVSLRRHPVQQPKSDAQLSLVLWFFAIRIRPFLQL